MQCWHWSEAQAWLWGKCEELLGVESTNHSSGSQLWVPKCKWNERTKSHPAQSPARHRDDPRALRRRRAGVGYLPKARQLGAKWYLVFTLDEFSCSQFGFVTTKTELKPPISTQIELGLKPHAPLSVAQPSAKSRAIWGPSDRPGSLFFTLGSAWPHLHVSPPLEPTPCSIHGRIMLGKK